MIAMSFGATIPMKRLYTFVLTISVFPPQFGVSVRDFIPADLRVHCVKLRVVAQTQCVSLSLADAVGIRTNRQVALFEEIIPI